MLQETTILRDDTHSLSNDNSADAIESEIKQIRERKFEKKEVVHHEPFLIFTGRRHTHATIIHITYSEERTVKIYQNGKMDYSDWSIVQGSQIQEIIKQFQEDGWTEGYIIEITSN